MALSVLDHVVTQLVHYAATETWSKLSKWETLRA